MRRIYNFFILIIVSMVLSGCRLSGSTQLPTQTATQTRSPTSMPPTFTATPNPTQTATLTPPAILEPKQAKETLQVRLQEPIDCESPCFWGIMPGHTTLGEAKNIFIHLGLQTENTRLDNKEFYAIEYDFDSSLSLLVKLTILDKIVENLRVSISPEKQQAGVPREWLAYSPETLIRRYGTPSKVDFFFGGAAPNTSYAMDMYFDSKDLIIEYYSYDLGPNLQVCPLTNQMSSVRVWMGDNPENPPPDAVLLEKATSMTMEEFTELMMGDPSEACFNLNIEAFR